MKGFEVDPVSQRLRIVNGARVVATTDGTLINLVPTLHTFTGKTVDFPDPPKGEVRAWSGFQQVVIDVSTDEYLQRQTTQTFYCRNSQELETFEDLVAAPAGADIFVGWVRLNRTTAPTHPWWGVTLNPLLPTNSWIPWNGSGWIEGSMGLTRLLHLVIEGGKLRLVMQQSVGPKIGGGAGGTFGIYPPSSLFARRVEGSGGIFFEVNNCGVPVWTSVATPYRQVVQRTLSTSSPLTYNPPDYIDRHPTLGVFPSNADPTDYRSIYSVDVKGYFGRRS